MKSSAINELENVPFKARTHVFKLFKFIFWGEINEIRKIYIISGLGFICDDEIFIKVFYRWLVNRKKFIYSLNSERS